MGDLEFQKALADMTMPELVESITRLAEAYAEYLKMITEEILIRTMQEAK